MVTGISLIGEATLVVLRRSGEAYQPISLGISGTYNRSGSIDIEVEDVNTDSVLTFFLGRLREGTFVVNEPGYPPIEAIEDLLYLFERNCLSYGDQEPSEPAAALDGAQITAALIAQPVWNALVATTPVSKGAAETWFERAFGDSTIAGEIYRRPMPELAGRARQLYAFNEFLARRGLTWAAPPEPSQRYPTDYGAQHSAEEIREFLAEACREVGDVEALRRALVEYEIEVNDLFGDPQ